MSTSVKVGISIVSVLVFIAIALTFIVKTQLTPEMVRKTLLPLVEKSLHRSVDFGEIEIGIFSGISVADLTVSDKNGAGELFSVESLELHYQLWPLFTGNVVIDQVLLNHPQIFVSRLPDGNFNFSDLLPQSHGDGAPGTADSDKGAAVSASTFSLLVKEVNVIDAELLYVDKFINAKSPYRYSLNQLNLKARQISLDRPFPIDISAVVNGANIDISGNYDFSSATGDLTLHLSPLDLVKFAPYYREFIPGKLGSGKLALNLEVDISTDAISSKGKIECNDVDLVLTDYPDASMQKAELMVNYAINYDLNGQLLQISTLLFDFNGVDVGAEGEVNFSTTDPYLVFSLTLDQFDLREAMQNLPLDLLRDYQKYSFAGMIDGRIGLAGPLSSGADLFKTASFSLLDVRASAENIRAGVSGDISYAENVLQTDNLQLQYGDQQAQMQLTAKKVNDLLKGSFKVTAQILDINKLLPDAPVTVDDNVNPDESKNSSRQVDEIGPFDLPVEMIGTMAIDRLIYKKLNIDKVTADLSLKDNHLSIGELSGRIGNGDFNGSAVVNLGVKGLAYNGAMTLRQPNISTLINGLTTATKQSTSGALQWHNSFSGHGTIVDELLQVLSVKGEYRLHKGEVRGSQLVEGLAIFLGSSDLKAISFNSFTGEYFLQNGVANFGGFLDSSKIKLTPAGTVSVAGDLDVKLDALFAPETINKLGIGKKIKEVLVDSDGWGRLPMQVRGTIDAPVFGFDDSAVQRMVVDKATERVSEKLLEKIAPDLGESVEPMKQLLDDTLNKLFSK